jgi:hypothetical protein
MNDETLGETVLEIVTMMLLAIVLAVLLMGAFGISLRAVPTAPKHARPRVVRSVEPSDRLAGSEVRPNP